MVIQITTFSLFLVKRLKKTAVGLLLLIASQTIGKPSLPAQLHLSSGIDRGGLASDYFCNSVCLLTKKDGELYTILGKNVYGKKEGKYSTWAEFCRRNPLNLTTMTAELLYRQLFLEGVLFQRVYDTESYEVGDAFACVQGWFSATSQRLKEHAIIDRKPTIISPNSVRYTVFLIEIPYSEAEKILTHYSSAHASLKEWTYTKKDAVALVKVSDLCDLVGTERSPYKVPALVYTSQGKPQRVSVSIVADVLDVTGLLLRKDLYLMSKDGKTKVYTLLN